MSKTFHAFLPKKLLLVKFKLLEWMERFLISQIGLVATGMVAQASFTNLAKVVKLSRAS